MTTRTPARLAELAETHLDPDAARRWLALLRPAVQLVPAGPGDPVVARIGGTPDLPPGTAWPEWPGHGRLSFVAEIDFDALAASGADTGLALPPEGRLLGFYFEPSAADDAVVLPGDPDTLPGSRLLLVTGTGPATGATDLTSEQVLTWPDMWHPALRDAGLDELPDAFLEALDELRSGDLGYDGFGRQVGGWAAPVQASVELEAAAAALGEATYDDVHRAEALRWRLLLQVDSDWVAGTAWEPATCLYWLARTDGVRPPRLPDDVAFVWQC